VPGVVALLLDSAIDKVTRDWPWNSSYVGLGRSRPKYCRFWSGTELVSVAQLAPLGRVNGCVLRQQLNTVTLYLGLRW
jgi:hypothetical protein